MTPLDLSKNSENSNMLDKRVENSYISPPTMTPAQALIDAAEALLIPAPRTETR